MDYQECIKKLYEINNNGGMKLGLHNMTRLNNLLGNPLKEFSSVHIAGSNGKGSVTTKIAKGLEIDHKKVGLYTSPHICTYRERIRVNGEMIPEKSVEKILNKIFTLIEQQYVFPTFFEITTMLAFLYFAEQQIDIAVLETGIGGRLDATNIVEPIITVITSISLEHTDLLGNTLEEIAYEKAGIIKPGIPLVIGPRAPFLEQVAIEKKCPFKRVTGFFADFDEENRAIAKAALEYLETSREAVVYGLDAVPPCRFEIVPHHSIPIILDVGHNPDGLEQLFLAIRQKFDQRIRVVFGLSKTKNISACLDILIKNCQAFHPVEAPNGRGASKQLLSDQLLEKGISTNNIFLEEDLQKTIQDALSLAIKNKEILLVCGTFFIMCEVREALGIEEERDTIEMNEAGVSKN